MGAIKSLAHLFSRGFLCLAAPGSVRCIPVVLGASSRFLFAAWRFRSRQRLLPCIRRPGQVRGDSLGPALDPLRESVGPTLDVRMSKTLMSPMAAPCDAAHLGREADRRGQSATYRGAATGRQRFRRHSGRDRQPCPALDVQAGGSLRRRVGGGQRGFGWNSGAIKSVYKRQSKHGIVRTEVARIACFDVGCVAKTRG